MPVMVFEGFEFPSAVTASPSERPRSHDLQRDTDFWIEVKRSQKSSNRSATVGSDLGYYPLQPVELRWRRVMTCLPSARSPAKSSSKAERDSLQRVCQRQGSS
eukprot:s3443_g12.t1